jgi:hypothetical protein
MTIIEDETRAPAELHPLQPAAIQRSADHRYTFEGKTYPGVTTILGMLDKSGPLMSWAARQTAEAFLELMRGAKGDWTESPVMNLLEAVGPEGVVKAVTSRSAWKRDEAANIGTEVHGLADDHVNGKGLPETLPATVRSRIEKYAEWWAASGWKLRLSEAMVVEPVDGESAYGGYGGTFDLLAYDRDGRTVLADIKTGKGVYREAVLQLAAYGMATYVAPANSPTAYPMVEPDRYVIIHVTEDGVREVELDIGQMERVAFLAMITIHAWGETMKGKRL